jgi:PqqD family protein of HPr-rel-A system
MQPPHWTAREASFVPPRRRDDIVEEKLDDEAILFDPRTGNTHRLNQTAYTVWRQCDGRATTRQIARRQTAAYDVDVDTALDHVEQLIMLLAESQLLDLSEQP